MRPYYAVQSMKKGTTAGKAKCALYSYCMNAVISNQFKRWMSDELYTVGMSNDDDNGAAG